MKMKDNQKNPTKVQQVCHWLIDKIERGIYPVRHKIPSIRQLSQKLALSTFTVSQAYDQLVALGYLKPVAGSGFFVCERTKMEEKINISPALINNVLDTGWLMKHLFNELDPEKSSGSGLLPQDWLLEEKIISNAIKKTSKEVGQFIYGYGHIQGYFPLRELYATQLDEIGIKVNPDLMITMPGVSSAIQIVVTTLLKPNDYIIVDDPSWFWLLGCLHQFNLQILTVPRGKDGVDIEKLTTLFEEYRPKLYITNSILNNPTSFNLSANNIYKVLNLLHQFDAYLLEDDIYSHLESENKTLRYMSLDQGERVFYLSGVSKVLGANWRVGFLSVPSSFLAPILKQKMLSNMTSTELTERSVYKIWLDPHYKRHIATMQRRLAQAHQRLRTALDQIGVYYDPDSKLGLFLWVDTGLDTAKMAKDADKEGWLLAPGYLFSPHAHFSTYLRLNVTRTSLAFIDWLAKYKWYAKHHA